MYEQAFIMLHDYVYMFIMMFIWLFVIQKPVDNCINQKYWYLD